MRRCIRKKDGIEYAVKIIKTEDEEIAVKVLKNVFTSLNFFKVVEEFNNMKRIQHPNIVKVTKLYIDIDSGTIFYIMEYVCAKEMLLILNKVIQYSGFLRNYWFLFYFYSKKN